MDWLWKYSKNIFQLTSKLSQMVQNEKLLYKMSLSGRKIQLSIIIGKNFKKYLNAFQKYIK